MTVSKLFIGTLVLATGAACTVTRSATASGSYRPHTHVTVASLETELAPHGEFIHVRGYGRVWRPIGMVAGWQPYTQGRWVQDAGEWVWASDLSWGWAAFHYGRWAHDDLYGWIWVPGNEWGPAWVAWSYDDGYVGWAPLPPGAYWTNAGWSVQIGSPRWYYVRRGDFRHRHIHRVGQRRPHHFARAHRRYPAPGYTTRSRPARRSSARPAPVPARRARAAQAPTTRRAHKPVITGRRSAKSKSSGVTKRTTVKREAKRARKAPTVKRSPKRGGSSGRGKAARRR